MNVSYLFLAPGFEEMEAIAVDKEVNDSKGDFSSRQSWTLSEVLNPGQFNLDKDRKRIPMAFTA